MPAFNGRYQSIRHFFYYRKVLFLWFHLLTFLKNDQFILKKWRKVVSKNVHFLVNYVAFVIHYCIQHLLNFSNWLFEYVCYTPKRLYFTSFSLLWGGTWHFPLKKWLFYGPTFFKFHFSKIILRICTPIVSSIGPSVFEKNDIFVRIGLFEKCKLNHFSRHWMVPAFNGRYQSIRHTLYYKKVIFSWFHFFEKWWSFSWKEIPRGNKIDSGVKITENKYRSENRRQWEREREAKIERNTRKREKRGAKIERGAKIDPWSENSGSQR